MSGEGDKGSTRPQHHDEHNPFVAFKRHIDQQFAALFGAQHVPRDLSQQRPGELRRFGATTAQESDQKHPDSAWEQAMRDFEQSEKEAKEWYNTVLKQITSRRDEHLESGLALGGQMKQEEADVAQCPYLPPKEERVELLPRINTEQVTERELSTDMRAAHCNRQQPHSRYFDWVWSGWGGPSTTSDMLWHHERKPGDVELDKARECKWTESIPSQTYSAGSPAKSAQPAWPVPGEMMPYASNASPSSDPETKELEQVSAALRELVQLVDNDVSHGWNAIFGQDPPQLYKKQVATFQDYLAKVEAEDVDPERVEQVKQLHGILDSFAPLFATAHRFASPLLGEQGADDDQTELGVYERAFKTAMSPASSVAHTQGQSAHEFPYRKQQDLFESGPRTTTTEQRTDELGYTHVKETTVVKRPNGQRLTEFIEKHLDPSGRIISVNRSEELYDSASGSSILQASPYERDLPVALRPRHSTTAEARKLLEKTKMREHQNGGGWFWRS